MNERKGKMLRMYEGDDKVFKIACQLAEVQPTHRQRKKWERGEGRAYEQKQEAHEQVNPHLSGK